MEKKENLENKEIFNIKQKIEFTLNMLNHIFIGFVTIYLTYICLKVNLKGTALHAWLCTIGYNTLMAEAIMCHYSGNYLTFTAKRKTKTTIHWVLMVLGGGLGIIGAIIMIAAKSTHFTTIHGITGLAATILSGISFVTGLAALFSTEIKKFFSPLYNKTFHVFLGLAAFVIGMVCMYYGYETKFFTRKHDVEFVTTIKALTLVSLILSSIGPIKSFYEKSKSILSY